ncbi:MAG: hypothetical protein ACXW27_14140 [Allosphingosinicella sp.]
MVDMSFNEAAFLLGWIVLVGSVAVVAAAIFLHEGKRRSDLARLLAGFGALLREWGEQARARPET